MDANFVEIDHVMLIQRLKYSHALRADTIQLLLQRAWTTCSNIFGLNSHQNWGELYDQFMRKIIFTMIESQIFMQAPNIVRKSATGQFRFAYHLALISWSLSYEIWFQGYKCSFRPSLFTCLQSSSKLRLAQIMQIHQYKGLHSASNPQSPH